VDYDSIATVIVPADQASPDYRIREPILHARVTSPWYIVVLRKLASCSNFDE
jgi:hypothetical protein